MKDSEKKLVYLLARQQELTDKALNLLTDLMRHEIRVEEGAEDYPPAEAIPGISVRDKYTIIKSEDTLRYCQ